MKLIIFIIILIILREINMKLLCNITLYKIKYSLIYISVSTCARHMDPETFKIY